MCQTLFGNANVSKVFFSSPNFISLKKDVRYTYTYGWSQGNVISMIIGVHMDYGLYLIVITM